MIEFAARHLTRQPFLVGADDHHVHLRQPQWLCGLGLPVRTQGAHHTVPAAEECGHTQTAPQQVQCQRNWDHVFSVFCQHLCPHGVQWARSS